MFRTLTFVGASVVALAHAAQGVTVTIGGTGHFNTLQADIQTAYATPNVTLIKVLPGTYQVTTKGTDPVTLTGINNVIIDGYDTNGVAAADIIPYSPGSSAIVFDTCSGLTFRGFNMHNATPQTVQGTITNISNNVYTVQFHAGYSTVYTNYAAVAYVFDPTTLLWKVGCGDSYNNVVSGTVGSPTCTVTMHTVAAGITKVGDYLVGRATPSAHVVIDKNCTGCTFKGLNVWYGGVFQFFESNGSANHFTYCTVDYGPTPTGATIRPLVSSSADGFHSTSAATGPEVDNCSFVGMPDDGINVVGSYVKIGNDSTVNVLHVSSNPNTPAGKAGDVIYVQQDPGYYQTSTLSVDAAPASLPPNGDPGDVGYNWTLATPLSSLPNLSLVTLGYDANYIGSGFKIHNNIVKNNRARGIRVAADNGSIKNNLVDGSTVDGILVANAENANSNDYEAGISHHVTISGNTIMNTGLLAPTKDAGIYISPSITTAQNLLIDSNTFEGLYGANIRLEDTKYDTVSNNLVIDPQLAPTPVAVDFGPTTGMLIVYDPNTVTHITETQNAVDFEGEDATINAHTSGVTPADVTDAGSSGGAFLNFPSTVNGNYIGLRLQNVASGNYDVVLGLRGSSNCGIWQTSIGAAGSTLTAIGSPFDEYSSAVTYPTYIPATSWASGAASDKVVQLKVTGKNSASSSDAIAIDYVLLRQP